jgi:hypothetical protein
MDITVRIQIGAGGEWHTEFRAARGPRNLFRASRAAADSQAWTDGVGGYTTVIAIGDHVIDRAELEGLTLAKARAICERPARYAPAEWCDEHAG